METTLDEIQPTLRLPQTANTRFLIRSVVFLGILLGLFAWLRGPVVEGFHANPPLNGTIVGILVVGTAFTLFALIRTLTASRAIARAEGLVASSGTGTKPKQETTQLVVSGMPGELATFLETVHKVVHQGEASTTLPYLLDSLATREEDRRAFVRFLTNSAILLGLIGTFYGLLLTIGGVTEVLSGLSDQGSDDTHAILSNLRERLSTPLHGMALAFSSSLFGLSTSLILAFLELQLFHAQSDVHARMETLVVSTLVPFWQAAVSPQPMRDSGPAHPDYLHALLEQTGERLEAVTRSLESLPSREQESIRIVESNALLAERIATLTSNLERLERDRTEELRSELRLMTRALTQGEYRRAPET